jgi:hypothetical protein
VKHFLGLVALGALTACGGQSEDSGAAEAKTTPVAVAATSEATSITASAAKESAEGVECKKDEDRIFSCNTDGGKRIAVCATPAGKTEYRFGAAKPELVLTAGQYASVPYSGGGEQQIAFDNGATRYVVFSRMVRTNFTPGEPNDPAISDGVIVLRNDKVLSVLTCGGPDADPMPVQMALADQHMKQQDELFTYETERADPLRTD